MVCIAIGCDNNNKLGFQLCNKCIVKVLKFRPINLDSHFDRLKEQIRQNNKLCEGETMDGFSCNVIIQKSRDRCASHSSQTPDKTYVPDELPFALPSQMETRRKSAPVAPVAMPAPVAPIVIPAPIAPVEMPAPTTPYLNSKEQDQLMKDINEAMKNRFVRFNRELAHLEKEIINLKQENKRLKENSEKYLAITHLIKKN